MPLPAYGETVFVNSRINKDSNATHHQVVNVCAVVAKGIYCMQSYWRLQKQAAAGRKLPLIFSSGGGSKCVAFSRLLSCCRTAFLLLRSCCSSVGTHMKKDLQLHNCCSKALAQSTMTAYCYWIPILNLLYPDPRSGDV